MTIDEIFNQNLTADQKIAALSEKVINVPSWGGEGGLESQYDAKKHPVMNRGLYPDTVDEDGRPEKVTRIALSLQKLATKRMTELVCGIPVKRTYSPENDRQKEIAKYIEKIYKKNRINSVNINRCRRLFAGCEVMTLWYAIELSNSDYGFDSKLKLRCRTFSPMNGDDLYPLFDEYGDLIALSVGYQRKVGKSLTSYFDTYTADNHYKWQSGPQGWVEIENEKITVGKIPAVYSYRDEPIWEDNSGMVYEWEWSMSRNGNYLRKNSKPLFIVFADSITKYGNEKNENKEFRSVMQYPKGSEAQYVTWEQAVDNLKFHLSEIRQSFFSILQLPDWSYEKMSQQAMSGESRKQLFIDADLKVTDESGPLLEMFDRETNVVKAFLKVMLPDGYADDIDALPVETEITPYSITDDKDTVDNLMTATGGKPIMSQREGVQHLGWSTDVDRTMNEMRDEKAEDAMSPAI